MKRRGPRLGEAPGTRMQPRARAAWSRLPPGRLNWGTAASAGPERSAAGASRTWSFRTAGPCRRRASSLGVLRAPVRQPRCLTVQPRRLTVQPARTPRSPVPFVSSRRWKPTENTPVACAQSRGGLATGWSLTWSLSPPQKKKFVLIISSLILLPFSVEASAPVASADGSAVTRLQPHNQITRIHCFWAPKYPAPNLTDFN